MSVFRLCLCSALVLSAAFDTFSAAAQTKPQQVTAKNTPTLQVYSRETIFDVLVTDADGKPVRGLTRSDFTVLEDGQPQPIRGFSEYDVTAPPPAPALPPNTWTNATTLPTKGPVQIFVFDLIGTRPAQMQEGKPYIADYFRIMPAGTQVAIFALSPSKGLMLLQDFTTDGSLAAAAVGKLDDEWLREPTYGVPIAIAGFNQIADYVAGIHGRKNLIWVIPGIPISMMIARDGGYSWHTNAPDMTYVHQLMDLYDIFTREQIAIYPFNPQGVHGVGFGALINEEVANGTGGDVIDNSNDYKANLAKIVDSTSHGYTLSFVPPRPAPDGHYHPITVKLDRPGLKLSYRTGFNDEQPQPPDATLKQQMIQGPMRLGALPATQLLFNLNVTPASGTPLKHVGPAAPHTKGSPYNVLFQFDPTQLTLQVAADGSRTASIEVDLGAYDSYSAPITRRTQTFTLKITPAQYNSFLSKPLEVPLPIDLPPGQLHLRAGLFDTAAGKTGTIELPLTVRKPAAPKR